ncbi:MAG TPA: hypothetical protein PLI09_28450 [Candidatus Hydrogenedentes bacterium]|nr:hypothetical protein [Candidatus Hydrogenedentota bacterium]
MHYLHDAQLANIVTSYATCLGGILPMIFVLMLGGQPKRWFFVYACILITGIPTVWLHSMEGNRVASFFDVGTNILLAYALQVAVAGDFMKPKPRRILLGIMLAVNVFVWGWLIQEIFAKEKTPLLSFGTFGQFYAGEVALILNAWVVVILFAINLKYISKRAKRLFYLIVATFFFGMILATASNSYISFGIFPWHAAWHIVGACGFITLFLFNHVRFNEPPESDSYSASISKLTHEII